MTVAQFNLSDKAADCIELARDCGRPLAAVFRVAARDVFAADVARQWWVSDRDLGPDSDAHGTFAAYEAVLGARTFIDFRRRQGVHG